MFWPDDLWLELVDTTHGGFEIVNLKPQQNPIAIWLIISIPYRTMVMIGIKTVQLKDKFVPRSQTLVFFPAVIARAPEQVLIPATARFDVGD